MHLNYLILSLIITLFFNSTVSAKDLMDPVIVTATKFKTKDTKATYASEVYTQEDLDRSGAIDLYEFLHQNTSVTVAPSYGNRLSQMIDVRGFGLVEGFKNVAITVDGRRLNNIDSVPQRLSDIAINNIDRIEITKGSGSVVYGDGATGGSIQIYTRNTTDTVIQGSFGNYGINTGSFTTGLSKDDFVFSLSGSHYQQDGFSDAAPDGNKDRGSSKNYSTKLKYFPTESSEFFIEKDHAYTNIRYANPLSNATFESDPGSNYKTTAGFTDYTFEKSSTDNLTLGGSIVLTPNLDINLDYTHQNKDIITGTSAPSDYQSNAINTDVSYRTGPFQITSGIQAIRGKRKNAYGTGSKHNTGIFVQTNYDAGNTALSIGARKELIYYTFIETTGDNNEESFDIGLNRTVNDNLSVFSNFNYAFLSPDIDRWFNYDGVFNGFLTPTRTQTLNLGLNHVTQKNKLKATVFGMKLRKEQFYNHKTFKNTNIDKSHKYGLELQNTYNFNNDLSTTISYTYIQAIIDGIGWFSALGCSDACKGHYLPGVSDHNLTLGINYTPTIKSRVVLTQIFRSEAYALEDFDNSLFDKNAAFTSTDLSYRYKLKSEDKNALFSWRDAELIAKIENLFAQSNGLQLRNDVVYPIQFTRNISLGAKINF